MNPRGPAGGSLGAGEGAGGEAQRLHPQPAGGLQGCGRAGGGAAQSSARPVTLLTGLLRPPYSYRRALGGRPLPLSRGAWSCDSRPLCHES